LRQLNCRNWPPAFVTSNGNAQAVQLIEPNLFDGACFAISQDDGFADKLGLSIIELGKDRGRAHFGIRHCVTRGLQGCAVAYESGQLATEGRQYGVTGTASQRPSKLGRQRDVRDRNVLLPGVNPQSGY